MYKFKIDDYKTFEQSIKILEKEKDILFLKNSIEQHIFIQFETQAKTAAKIFRFSGIDFDSFLMTWQLKKEL